MDDHSPLSPADSRAQLAWDDDLRVALADEDWSLVDRLLADAPPAASSLPRWWIARTLVCLQRGQPAEAQAGISEAQRLFPSNPFIADLAHSLGSEGVPAAVATPDERCEEPSVDLQLAYIDVVENNRQLEAVVADLRASLAAARADMTSLQEGLADVRSAVERLQAALDTVARGGGLGR